MRRRFLPFQSIVQLVISITVISSLGIPFEGIGGRYAQAAPIPKLLQEVERKYFKAKTLQADFTQTTQSVGLPKPRVSEGKLFIKQPNLFRWQTEKPDSSLVITNQSKVIYYTPPFEEGEQGQLIERESSEIQSRLVNALLAGSFSIVKEIKITQTDPVHFVLTPKKGSAATVETAVLEIDPKLNVIQKVTLNHFGGNKSEIQLSDIQLSKPLGNELFSFKAPPNTAISK